MNQRSPRILIGWAVLLIALCLSSGSVIADPPPAEIDGNHATANVSPVHDSPKQIIPTWKPLETINRPHRRHEAAFVQCNGRFYLLGGRRVQPVDIFDPATRTWTEGSRPPMEIHHFQPVVWDDKILMVGAMTKGYPREKTLDRILVYEPEIDRWTWGAEIPKDRRRGGAGSVIHDGYLYLVSGIQNGHWDGWVPWLDRYDLKNQTWERLPDAPRSRDHFQAAVIGDEIYAAGGRRSSASTKQVLDLTIEEVDVYNIKTGQWRTLPKSSNLPIPRAGCFSFVRDSELVIAGGESMLQQRAHNEIHSLDTTTGKWRIDSRFDVGRHGTGIVQWEGKLYTVAGSGERGGTPELDTTEILKLN